MNKIRKVILPVITAAGFLLLFSSGVQAEEGIDKSKGNMTGAAMELMLYEQDIRYLETEVDRLLQECRED